MQEKLLKFLMVIIFIVVFLFLLGPVSNGVLLILEGIQLILSSIAQLVLASVPWIALGFVVYWTGYTINKKIKNKKTRE